MAYSRWAAKGEEAERGSPGELVQLVAGARHMAACSDSVVEAGNQSAERALPATQLAGECSRQVAGGQSERESAGDLPAAASQMEETQDSCAAECKAVAKPSPGEAMQPAEAPQAEELGSSAAQRAAAEK